VPNILSPRARQASVTVSFKTMAVYSPFITPGDVLGDFGANGWAPARRGYYLFLSYCPAHHGAIAGVLGELEGVIRVQVKDGIGYIALTSQASALSTVEVLRMMRCALVSQEEWHVPVFLTWRYGT
jgi:cytochrome c1